MMLALGEAQLSHTKVTITTLSHKLCPTYPHRWPVPAWRYWAGGIMTLAPTEARLPFTKVTITMWYNVITQAQSHLSSSLACASLVLLGGRHHDIMTLAPSEARLPLTDLDRRKLNSLLKRPYLDNAVGVYDTFFFLSLP